MAAALARAAGLTAVAGGLGGPRALGYDDEDHLTVDFEATDRTLAAVRAAGFEGPFFTDYGLRLRGIGEAFEPLDVLYGRPYAEVLADLLAATRAHAAEAGWPPLIHLIGDAPEGAGVGDALALSAALKAADPQARTAAITPFSNPEAPQGAFAGAVDLLLATTHTDSAVDFAVEAGTELVTTGHTNRYRQGVYQFALRLRGGAGHFESALSSPTVDPYFALDGRDDDVGAAITHPSGTLRPTVEWARTQQAVVDLRYLLALEQAIVGGPRSRAKVAAEEFLAGVLARLPLGDFEADGYTEPELDALRGEIAEHIVALAGAVEEVWDWGPEAGMGDGDVGVTETDVGGAPLDGGLHGDGGKGGSGCGCRATGDGAPMAWLLGGLLLLGWGRRRVR